MNIRDEIRESVQKSVLNSIENKVSYYLVMDSFSQPRGSIWVSVGNVVYNSVYNSVNGNIANEMFEYEYTK